MYSSINIHTRNHLYKHNISHLIYEFSEKNTPYYKIECAKRKIRRVFNIPKEMNDINNKGIHNIKENKQTKRNNILNQICYLSEHIYGGDNLVESERNTSSINVEKGKYIFDRNCFNNNETSTYNQGFFFTSSQNPTNVKNNGNTGCEVFISSINEKPKQLKGKCHSLSSIIKNKYLNDNDDIWLNEHKGKFLKFIKLHRKRKFEGCKPSHQSSYVLPQLGYKCNFNTINPDFPEDKSDSERHKIENFKIKEIMDKRKLSPFKY